MTAPYPVLTNGMATDQGIWDIATTPRLPVGTRGALGDGRVYYYACNSSTALTAGVMLSAEVASVDMDDMATGTYAIGTKTLAVTPVGTKTYAADELAEGWLTSNSGSTGQGPTYKIRSNDANTAATAFNVEIYDGLVTALDATATIHVVKNIWRDPVIAPTSAQGVPAGVANIGVPLGSTTKQYFWCQTWGPCAVTAGSASAVGDALMNDSTTAGETLIATAGNPVVGVAYTLGVNADWVMAFLTIAA